MSSVGTIVGVGSVVGVSSRDVVTVEIQQWTIGDYRLEKGWFAPDGGTHVWLYKVSTGEGLNVNTKLIELLLQSVFEANF